MNKALREHARMIWNAAIDAVRPEPLVGAALADGSPLHGALEHAHRILVVGAGKAGAAMSAGVEQALAGHLDRVTGVVNVPGGPDCMEMTDDGKTLWVTLRWIKKVAVIDVASKKVLKLIPVGRSPHGVYFINHAPRL